jgi:glycosyltransferase involved in cell wall biosynthesis
MGESWTFSDVSVGKKRSPNTGSAKFIAHTRSMTLNGPANKITAQPKIIKNEILQAETVLFHGFYQFHLILVLLLRKNSNVYIMPHGTLEEYETKHSRLRKYAFRILFKFLSKDVAIKFLLASKSEKKGVLKCFPNKKVAVVGLGINLEEIIIRKKEYLNEPIKLICLSRIAQKKRIDIVIRCLSLLPRNKFHLDILGNGDSNLLRKLQNLVHELEIDAEVSFLGFVGGNMKYHFLSESDILLLPSENENFAVAAAEAVASGVPVVLSKHVAFSEFVLENMTGVIVRSLSPKEIAEAIMQVCSNFANYKESCLVARVNLSWNSVIKKWLIELEN